MIDATLQRPVSFAARLNIQSWLQRIAFLTGAYESDTVDFLNRLWRSGGATGYLLDIGASVSMISIPFALMVRNTSTGHTVVIAVEAVPDNARALETNIAMKRIGNPKPFPQDSRAQSRLGKPAGPPRAVHFPAWTGL